MNQVAAGIIIYNPDLERLRLNIVSIINQVDKIYVYNNASSNTDKLIDLTDEFPSVVVLQNIKNVGIAKALNELVDIAHAEGFLCLLTLDQDSIMPHGSLCKYMEYIYEDRVALICPVMNDTRRKNIKKEGYDDAVVQVKFCITSGSLLKLSVCKNIGKFDDFLFVGLVDNEYCLRLHLNNYKILQVNSVVMDHQLGVLVPSKYEKIILGFAEIINNNTIKKLSYKRKVDPVRLYYSTRNMVYLARKYRGIYVKDWSKLTLFKNSIFSIFRGESKIQLMLAVWKGIIDGRVCPTKFTSFANGENQRLGK